MRFLAALVAAFLFPALAGATTIVATGTVQTVSDPLGFLGVSVGDPFEIVILFDPTASDNDPSPDRGSYGIPLSLAFSQLSIGGTLVLEQDPFAVSKVDVFVLGNVASYTVPIVPFSPRVTPGWAQFSLGLEYAELATDSLPVDTDGLTFAAISLFEKEVGFNYTLTGDVTDVRFIPEATEVALLGSALLWIAGSRFRRLQKKTDR